MMMLIMTYYHHDMDYDDDDDEDDDFFCFWWPNQVLPNAMNVHNYCPEAIGLRNLTSDDLVRYPDPHYIKSVGETD